MDKNKLFNFILTLIVILVISPAIFGIAMWINADFKCSDIFGEYSSCSIVSGALRGFTSLMYSVLSATGYLLHW